ncbi:DUF1272 domain-containing protein [Microbacterium sp.]|jgi:hypothetical protein|uniref:DUF1272 domain-containing protein n=1 Tax=Microbacterium sp. TaxID=51671 RepID=UPI002C575AA3|nr:DUF1272 domain-containing protein [Microbacterium sp.]HWL77533.1 DUF1272 domain-containing protein [Microbacterium sp.]
MLELRPNCEWCGVDLPPNDVRARICSYECTYCAECAENILQNVCPTCGGDMVRRPIRPAREWRPGSGLGLRHHPAGEKRHETRWTLSDAEHMIRLVGSIPPDRR